MAYIRAEFDSLICEHSRVGIEKKLRDRGHFSLFSRRDSTSALTVIDLFQAILAPRIESLPSDHWQTQVHACFSKNISKKVDASLAEHHTNAYRQTKELLQLYEELVPLILLDLAAWKAACIIRGPILHGSPTSCLLWLSEGWKKSKQDHFHCNEMEIIVSSVAPFLYEKDHFSSLPQFDKSKKRRAAHGSPAVEQAKQKRNRVTVESDNLDA